MPRPRPQRRLGLPLLVVVFWLFAYPTIAQRGIRPADAGPPLPGPTADAIELAPNESTGSEAPSRPGPAALSIRPKAIDIQGCTAFGPETLAGWTEGFDGRPLTGLDLSRLLDRIRRTYHDAGYVTTEVLLPDQDLEDEVLRIQVVEGRVLRIRVEGARFYAAKILEARLRTAAGVPLHLPSLRARLESIQSEPSIDRVLAELEEVGTAEHVLTVRIEDRLPWHLRVGASNHRSPSVGSVGGRLEVANDSLLGIGDRFQFSGHWTEGVRDLALAWQVPVSPWQTRLSVGWRTGEADVVEGDFEAIDIVGRFDAISLGLHQPLVQTRRHLLDTALVGEWRRSVSTLLGRIQCFQSGLEDCTPTAAILRWQSDYRFRGTRGGLALRSTLSFGLEALSATESRDRGGRDGQFVSWLIQGEWAGLLPRIDRWPAVDGSQLLIRGGLQLANDPLLSFEQIAIGGARSVRGFRQNQLVRDNGAFAQIELRVPLYAPGFGERRLEAGPFLDYGSAWDRRRGRSTDETLVSIGLALRMNLDDRVRGELSWAHRLRDDLPRGDRLQRNGLFFEVIWDVF